MESTVMDSTVTEQENKQQEARRMMLQLLDEKGLRRRFNDGYRAHQGWGGRPVVDITRWLVALPDVMYWDANYNTDSERWRDWVEFYRLLPLASLQAVS